MAKVKKWLKKENLQQLTEWAKNKDYNISDIASLMGISVSTFYEWKKNNPEIEAAFEEGRRVLDEKVENSFFDMCVGFLQKVKKQYKLRRKEFENGKVVAEYEELVEAEEEEYIPPSVAAQKFYLCNRMPDRYRPETAVLPSGKDDDEKKTGVVELPAVHEEVIDAEIVENEE